MPAIFMIKLVCDRCNKEHICPSDEAGKTGWRMLSVQGWNNLTVPYETKILCSDCMGACFNPQANAAK